MVTASNAGYAFADPARREQDVTVTEEPDAMGAGSETVNVSHPAFGRIRASRVSGQTILADVDYPQQHYVTLTISTASLRRNLSRDWWFGGTELIEVGLSEVQRAQMLTGMNTEGVVCTIMRSNPGKMPATGLVPAIPPRASDAESHKAEAQHAADKAMKKVSEAEQMLRDLLKGSGSITKGKLTEVLNTLVDGRRSATESLPFIVDSAVESIGETEVKAKSNFNAFMGHAMNQLGERAMGMALAYAQSQGADPKQALLDAIAPSRPAEIEGPGGDQA